MCQARLQLRSQHGYPKVQPSGGQQNLTKNSYVGVSHRASARASRHCNHDGFECNHQGREAIRNSPRFTFALHRAWRRVSSNLLHQFLTHFIYNNRPIVYPCNAGMSGESHFFLQYKSCQAAAYACNLSLDFRDIRILPLGQHPYLYHQYRLARQLPAASALPDHSRGIVPLAGVKRVTAGSKHRTRRSPKANNPTTYITPSPGTEAVRGRRASDSSICSTASDSSSSPVLQAVSGASVNEPPSPSDKVDSTPSTGENSERTSGHISSPVISEPTVRISVEDAPASAALPISCETVVAVNLFGQFITCDLKADDSDPRVVIELLKASKSERTAYLTVAAFYRRSGNPQSAKAVLTSMLEGDPCTVYL